MNKILSIIVPSYNMEAYLRTCLGSLVVDDADLLRKLDVIVVNDGSTDATSAIAHEFATRYPSVFRVIDKPNGHYGSCVNRGLAEAQGDFVKVLDADDSLDSKGFLRYLRHIDSIIAAGDPVDLVWTDYRFVDEKGAETAVIRHALEGRSDLTLDDLTRMPQDRSMPATTYHRSIFAGLNYRQSEGIAYTDSEFMFLPMTVVKRICHLPIVVYQYFLGRPDQSMNAQVLGKQLAMLRQVFLSRMAIYCERRGTWSPESLRYAQSELTRAATCLYRMHLQASVFGNLKVLREIDRRIAADIPELLSRIGETDVLFAGKPYAIPYGKLVAQHPALRVLIAAALLIKARVGCIWG